MPDTYDVVVVGAGPAGSCAAYIAARAGLSTLLLERRQEIGAPVRCAEAVSRVRLPDFVAPDPRWIAKVVHGIRVIAPDGGHLDIVRHSNHKQGFVLERKLFDRYLAELAAGVGAEVRVKCRVTAVNREKDSVCGVRVKAGGREETIATKVVIAADGIESQIGRWAGLDTGPRLADLAVCVQYVLCGVHMEDPDYLRIYFGNEIAPGGYAWAFPKGGHTWNVGLGIRPGLRDTHGQTAQHYLDRFVMRLFPGTSAVSMAMGSVPTGARKTKLSGGGIMIVGDAAHLVNPLTGAGITNAMRSGVLAAETAVEAYSRGDLSANSLTAYDRKCHKVFWKKFSALARIRDAVASLSDLGLSSAIGTAKRNGAISMLEFLRVAVGTDPRVLTALGNLLIYGYFGNRWERSKRSPDPKPVHSPRVQSS